MPIIVKRPKALGDLAQIWDYIADDSEELAPALRSFPVGRYLIFYVALTNGVDIVRVLHGSRDIATLFQDDDG